MDEPPNLANEDDSDKQSSENFQKFIFELFEKNGVIHDLRAYLRGHIVNILKNSDSGEALVCKKNFTQRLELTFQAINILIAEYLLRLEFSYSLSVFVSEIPLANMVFSFASMLMETHDHSELRFKDPDVFSILQYIGIKCDSEHANLILDTYKNNEKTPLLLCILRCFPRYGKKDNEKEIPLSCSQDSNISPKSSEENSNQFQDKCRHHEFCKSCRNKLDQLKDKYKRKIKNSVANIFDSTLNSLNVDMFLKNISLMEKGLIDELFQQLKSVYETEMEIIKQDEEKRVQRSLAVHLLQLKQKRDQLESSYKAREAKLQVALQEKKRFLWGLAKTLREQHQHMAQAMAEVKAETERLAAKEESLRLQVLEAEKILRKRGAEMRKKISSELSILENHLDSMKRERDSIGLERQQLQNLKLPNTNLKPLSESDELKSHYELLRDELNILKRYVQSVKIDPKCMIERSTMTELSGVFDKFEVVLNNGKEVDLNNDEPKRVINDLKKFKNINFDPKIVKEQPHKSIEERSPGRSSTSSEGGDAPDVDTTLKYFTLQNENRRLRKFARQQREHIDSLSWQQARLQAQISSQKNSITPLMAIASGSRPVAPQNAKLTTQNITYTPRNTTVRSGNVPGNTTSTPGNTTLTPGNAPFSPGNTTFTTGDTTFTPRNTTLNPQIGSLTSQTMNIAAQNSSFAPFIFQSTLPVPQGIGSQLLPTRPQPVANQGAVLQRPRTAPLLQRNGSLAQRLHPTASINNVSVGWRIGAGEELNIFSTAGPRVVVPGDEIPFVGVIGTRQTDSRRYLINQWRSLRRRLSPHISKNFTPCITDKKSHTKQETATANESQNVQPSCSKNDTDQVQSASYEEDTKVLPSKRDKSPRTLLKEARNKLNKKDQTKLPSIKREKSPNSVLREAKHRLKKLEIEAEAVEKSYLDFRKKRSSTKEEFQDSKVDKLDAKETKTPDKNHETDTNNLLNTTNFDKYLSEINTKLNLSKYKNKVTTAQKITPIPKEYSEKQEKKDYLETPITEFRKYYHSGKRYEKDLEKIFEIIDPKSATIEKTGIKSLKCISKRKDSPKRCPIRSINSPKSPKSPTIEKTGIKSPKSISKRKDSPTRSPIRSINSPKSPNSPKGTRKNVIRQVKNDKEKELEILKQNIGKIYNISERLIVEMSESTNEIDNKVASPKKIINEAKIITAVEKIKTEMVEDNNSQETGDINLLRVEVENTAEVNNVNTDSKVQDITFVIESSLNEDKTENPIPKDHSSKNLNTISTQKTIVVSPIKNPVKVDESPKNIVEITEEKKNIRVENIQHFNNSESDLYQKLMQHHQIEDADYFDDFSADVDNYNSRSELGHGFESPISLAAASDNGSFWES